MSKEILEDMQQAPNVGAGGAKAKLEKQARQLAYDTKYKVKQALSAKSGGNADPAAVAKMYLAQLAKSPAPPAIKALAKKKLMGEEYVDVKGFVVDSVTDALLKVFVEKKDDTVEEVIEEEKGEQKFHIKVTDKKTGNTYHRYATRAKISELRANSNIATVEMSHQGESGTKAKKDYDGDGKVESSSKEHAGAVHNAIQKAKGGTPDGKDTRKEELEITEKKHEEGKIGGGNIKKLAAKANKRIDADVDGDVDTDDMKSPETGEFVPSPDGKKKLKPKVRFEGASDWRNELEEGAAWTKKSGKSKSGGLNEKGRKSYEAENPGSDLKAPSKKKGNKRRASFCARMKGMKKKLTSAKTARDPDSRINKSLRAWNC